MIESKPMKDGRGRPTKKVPERIAKIMDLVAAGKPLVEVSKIVGIGERTLHDWKVQDWAFSAALKESQAIADDMVEMSAFKRAVGYEHPEEKIFYDSKNGEIVRAETKKHYPPDTQAIVFWLKNRRPKDWKDKVEVVHGFNEEEEQIAPDGTVVRHDKG